MKRIALAVLLVAAAVHAGAVGPIYRCGSEYTQDPCPGGKLVDVSDPRSAAQRAEAARVTAAERRRVAELARERKANEATEKASGAKAAGSAAKQGKAKEKRTKATRIVPLKAVPAS